MEEKIPVLLTLRFTDEQVERLRAVSPRLVIRQQSVHEDRDDITSFLQEDDQVVYCSTPPRDPSRAPHLKWVQLHSAGINQLANHPIWKTEIAVTTSSGIHAVPIGEFAIGMMLALARKLPRMSRLQERAEWPKHRWELLLGSELRGKTVGIIGYGSIGREIARMAHDGFKMHVLAMKHREGPGRLRYNEPGVGDPEDHIPERWFKRDELEPLLTTSDFVVLTLPLTPESRKIIGEPQLQVMKPTAFLINIARGELIDEHALVRALKENRIAGAGLDVFAVEPLPRDRQLWHMENVIVAPHVSAATPHYDDRAIALFSENLGRFLDGQPLLNLVDRTSGY
ncbi:MAG: D-2-hydroxyacid dehydrogenase [Anaerolineae bacterium]